MKMLAGCIEKREFYLQLTNMIEEGFYHLQQFKTGGNKLNFIQAVNNIQNNLTLLEPKIVESGLADSISIIRKLYVFRSEFEKVKKSYDSSILDPVMKSVKTAVEEYHSKIQTKIEKLSEAAVKLDVARASVITPASIVLINKKIESLRIEIEKAREEQY